jgi:predicted methyltransferase
MQTRRRLARLLASCAAGLIALAAAPADDIPAAIRAAVDAKDRSADDRALDAGRHPAQMLAFFGIRPGMRVAELGAGGGYTTELLARTVGPEGRVWGQNTPFMLERFAAKPWAERLARPVMKNVVRLDRSFEDPFPPEVKNLDAVLIVLLYHDTVWMKTDRTKMNAAVFAALAPGGVYGIVDHSAKPGTGLADVESLHRIDEAAVIREVEAAGFTLSARGDFLRNPDDARDWSPSPRVAGERRGTSDRFVLEFAKPRGQDAR